MVQKEQECCQRKRCKARNAWIHFAYWTFVFSLQSNESTLFSYTFTSHWVPGQSLISPDLGLCNKLFDVHWYRWLPSYWHCPSVFALRPCYIQEEAYLFLQVLIIPYSEVPVWVQVSCAQEASPSAKVLSHKCVPVVPLLGPKGEIKNKA